MEPIGFSDLSLDSRKDLKLKEEVLTPRYRRKPLSSAEGKARSFRGKDQDLRAFLRVGLWFLRVNCLVSSLEERPAT